MKKVLSQQINNSMRENFFQGAIQSWPMIINAVLFGIVFGIVARDTGLSAINTVLMNGLVNAGSSQLIALSIWSDTGIATIAMIVMFVNVRHILMSLTIASHVPELMSKKGWVAAYFITDGTWSIAMRHLHNNPSNVVTLAYIIGSGIAILIPWLFAAYLGHTLGGLIPDYTVFGLDFFSAISFAALLGGMWNGRKIIIPWAVAALCSISLSLYIPIYWAIPIAAIIAASLATVINKNE